MGHIQIMDHTGDETVIKWNTDDASVAAAEKEFSRLKSEGYEFFLPAEVRGKRIKKFDRNFGRILASPGVKTSKKRPRAMSGGPNDDGGHDRGVTAPAYG